MAASLDRYQVADCPSLVHRLAHVRRLIVRDLVVLRPVNHQERRHPLVYATDGRYLLELRQARLIELLDTEETDSAAITGVPVDARHVEPFGMLAPLQRQFAVVHRT